MLDALARVFSSQGVVMQTTRLVPMEPEEMGPTSLQGIEPAPVSKDKGFNQAAYALGERLERAMGISRRTRRVTPATEMTEAETELVEKLKARDQEVRAHEQKHLAAAGRYAQGGPKFEFEVGPDHKSYAIGGHVDIDVSPVPGDPKATLEKARAVQRAALAPGDASAQDQAVASQAASMAMEAQRQAQEPRSGSDRPGKMPGEYRPSREQSLLHPCGSGPCTCRAQVTWDRAS